MGTSTYIAPEQSRSAATVDGRRGCLCAGCPALRAARGPCTSLDGSVDVISAQLREEPPPLKQRVPALPAALSAFIPDARPRSPRIGRPMTRCRDMFGGPWEKVQERVPRPRTGPFTEAGASCSSGRKGETQALLLPPRGGSRGGRQRGCSWRGPVVVGKSPCSSRPGLLPQFAEPPPPGTPAVARRPPAPLL